MAPRSALGMSGAGSGGFRCITIRCLSTER